MKNFIIAVLTTILLAIIGYYCYIYYYKKETFQSDNYKLPIDNSKLTKEMFPNYNKIIEKPVSEKEIILGFVKEIYSLDGSSLFHDTRNNYYEWYKKSDLIKIIRENPKKITTLFNNYKKDFYKLVPNSTFRNSNIKTIFELLIMSYDDLHQNPDLVSKNMKTIYNCPVSSNNDETYENLNFHVNHIISPNSSEAFENIYKSNDTKLSEYDRNWFYSFWARRYKEGNIDQTIAIIREVSNHYDPDFEESNE